MRYFIALLLLAVAVPALCQDPWGINKPGRELTPTEKAKRDAERKAFDKKQLDNTMVCGKLPVRVWHTQSETRLLNDAFGTKVSARLVKIQPDFAIVQPPKGKEIRILRTMLIPADQKYIAQQEKKLAGKKPDK